MGTVNSCQIMLLLLFITRDELSRLLKQPKMYSLGIMRRRDMAISSAGGAMSFASTNISNPLLRSLSLVMSSKLTSDWS